MYTTRAPPDEEEKTPCGISVVLKLVRVLYATRINNAVRARYNNNSNNNNKQ